MTTNREIDRRAQQRRREGRRQLQAVQLRGELCALHLSSLQRAQRAAQPPEHLQRGVRIGTATATATATTDIATAATPITTATAAAISIYIRMARGMIRLAQALDKRLHCAARVLGVLERGALVCGRRKRVEVARVGETKRVELGHVTGAAGWQFACNGACCGGRRLGQRARQNRIDNRRQRRTMQRAQQALCIDADNV